MQIKGIGVVKAIQLKAVCELAKRMSRPINKMDIRIKDTKDVFRLLGDELRFERREKVKLLILNIKNILLKIVDVSYGGTHNAILETKDVFAEPIKMGAPRIILVHNHPSGDPTPSVEDVMLTRDMYRAGLLLGIVLIDHVVIGYNKCKKYFRGQKGYDYRMKLFSLTSRDIGMDLGTSNILITIRDKGIVLNEPSVVAIDRRTGRIVATGYEAKEMLGRTPEQIRAVRPMKEGVIADFTATGLMIKNIISKVCKRYNIVRPRVVVGVPSGITEVEERAVQRGSCTKWCKRSIFDRRTYGCCNWSRARCCRTKRKYGF